MRSANSDIGMRFPWFFEVSSARYPTARMADTSSFSARHSSFFKIAGSKYPIHTVPSPCSWASYIIWVVTMLASMSPKFFQSKGLVHAISVLAMTISPTGAP